MTTTLQTKWQHLAALDAEIDEKTQLVQKLRTARNLLQTEITAEVTGFNVGDTVEWGGRTKKRGVVEALHGSISPSNKPDRMSVRRSLKSGALSGTTVTVYSFENPTRVTPENT